MNFYNVVLTCWWCVCNIQGVTTIAAHFSSWKKLIHAISGVYIYIWYIYIYIYIYIYVYIYTYIYIYIYIWMNEGKSPSTLMKCNRMDMWVDTPISSPRQCLVVMILRVPTSIITFKFFRVLTSMLPRLVSYFIRILKRLIHIYCRWDFTLQWRHNEHDGVSNHQPPDCLLNHLFRCRSKKTSTLRVTGLCAENSPVTSEFPAQRTSNAENVSILMTSSWWELVVNCVSIERIEGRSTQLAMCKRDDAVRLTPEPFGASVIWLVSISYSGFFIGMKMGFQVRSTKHNMK